MGQELVLNIRGSAETQGQVGTGVPGAAGLRWALRGTCTQRSNVYTEYLSVGIHEPLRVPGALLHTHRYLPLMFL